MNQEKNIYINKLEEYLLATASHSLHDIARRYVLITELYDRTIMTGPIVDDCIYPGYLYSNEQIASNKHAQRRANERNASCLRLNISCKEILKEEDNYTSSKEYSHDLHNLLQYVVRSDVSWLGHGSQ